MNFLELAQKRYATKRYDETFELTTAQIEALKEIMVLSPSSINSQPWRFYFITDKAKKQELAKFSLHNQHKIEQCSLLIVLTVQHNLAEFEQFLKDFLGTTEQEMFDASRKNMGDEQVINWMTHQLYIALGFCLSACVSMNLDATPMEGIEHLKYKEILNTGSYFPMLAVAVGKHDPSDFNHPSVKPKRRRNIDDVIIEI